MSPSKQIVARRVGAPEALARGITDYLGHVPPPQVRDTAGSRALRSQAVIDAASRRAAMVAGSLALPPGPVGWITLLPEMISIWRIQAQMVSDLAAIHGRSAVLGREQMLYCLFRHSAAQAVRDLVVQTGDRLLFRRTTLEGIQRVARHIGMQVSRRTLGEGLSRWLPLIGAVGVGLYARYDTRQVGRTAQALFAEPVQVEVVDDAPADATREEGPRRASARVSAAG